MTSALLALQFLSIIPVRIKSMDSAKIGDSLIFFPLVGLFFGIILVFLNNLFLNIGLMRISGDIVLVVCLVILTGGIHLDGLSDTFDAFLSRKSKEEKLIIMHDPYSGPMGVSAIISTLLLKVAFLCSITAGLKPAALIIMCVLSRWAMVLLISSFPYARKEGKAKYFIEGINTMIFSLSTAIACIVVMLIWQLQGLLTMILVSLFALLFGKMSKNKIGGITGDVLGAANEIVETFILFIFVLIERGNLCLK